MGYRSTYTTPRDAASLRPFLIALVAAVLLNMALRLRILEHVLRAHQNSPWLIGVIARGLLVVFAALLVAFWWLLLVRVLPEFHRGLAPSRRLMASLVWLAPVWLRPICSPRISPSIG